LKNDEKKLSTTLEENSGQLLEVESVCCTIHEEQANLKNMREHLVATQKDLENFKLFP
jgi:hypothetical protein